MADIEEILGTTTDLESDRLANVKRHTKSRMARETRHLRRRQIAVTAGTLSLAAATAMTLMLTTTAPASASWSAIPAPLSMSLDDPMVAQCLASMSAGSMSKVGSPTLTVVVAERRGTSRAALLDSGDSQAICIATPTSRTGGRTLSSPLPAGQDILISGNGGSTDPSSGERYVYGRISRRIADVTVTTTGGTEVTASTANGSFVAWWPAGASPRSIAARAADGQVLATINL